MTTMKAFRHKDGELYETEASLPELRPHDVLVRVLAAGMNPVDGKAIHYYHIGQQAGFDGVGIVEKLGSQATMWKVGDKVFGAGDISRDGTNADYWAVDERILAKAPAKLDDAHTATIALAALTAYEGIFESMGVNIDDVAKNKGKKILMLPGAGGVGSYLIQLAKVAGLTVIATASRPDSADACRKLGADYVINHRDPLAPQLKELGIDKVQYIFNAWDINCRIVEYNDIIDVCGHIHNVIDSKTPLDINMWRKKRVIFSFGFMFSRPMLVAEPEKQHQALAKIVELIDAGRLQIPSVEVRDWSLDNLKEMHKLQASGTVIGKLAITKTNATGHAA